MRSFVLWPVLLSALFGLVACGGGGGGGGGNMRPDPPPSSAPPTPAPPPPPAAPPPPVVFAPNPEYSRHLSITNTSAAHQAGFNGAGVRIGVLDSGVMRNHPALAPRVLANLNYVASPPNNLLVDDAHGHGTAVSQIMAGRSFGAWPGGIAPGAEIVSARILNDTDPPDGGDEQVTGELGLRAIHQELINRGVRVMNNSWGGLTWTNPAVTNVVADEYRAFVGNGLVVFAAGNDSQPNPSSIASLPSQAGPGGSLPAADLERGWLAVAALDTASMQLASYSNACGVAMRYCLLAPGDVVVTGTGDGPTSPTYWRWTGTSLAAPQVAGAAALVWQAFPYFNNDLVRQTLLGTATDMGAVGVDATTGYGLLNVGRAVQGPGRFDWGDVTVSFDGGTSTWSNQISGAGGLTKLGSGTLVLASGANLYSGQTRILGGTLRANNDGLPGPVVVGSGATLEKDPSPQLTVRGSLANSGTVKLSADGGIVVQGEYRQNAGARLAVYVGNVLRADTAVLQGGDLQVLGVRSGYVRQSRENVLVTSSGLTGTFTSLSAGAGVLLEAVLGYDARNAWLDINRLSVTAAAQSMGLSATAVSSSQRVEGAFDAIDSGQLASGDSGADFLTGAGLIQRMPDAAAAEQTLSSLSGELHGADTAFALMAIEGNRRALESRVDTLQLAPASGAWVEGLSAQRAVSHFDADAYGWTLGQDRRFGERLTLGTALAQTEGHTDHDLRYDSARNRLVEGQFYAAYDLGRAYLMGSLALGRMQSWTRRDVLLGAQSFLVDADYAHRYATAGAQVGLPLAVGAGRIVPYVGVQALQLQRDGFSEPGAAGFGLSTSDSTTKLSQGLLGARVAWDWLSGSTLWSLQGRVEWQRLLSGSGGDIQARFSALDVWSPIRSEAPGDARVLGFGLGARLRHAGRIGLDIDARHDQDGLWASGMLTWSVGY
ncbi:S8 family serine peptidase [Lysobacter sp. S4-A87]|uniref:autotransporter serine protease n=1 Tax=Lysobacter sp. S4-A87 TaxID=2925843 RepID=UPI001F534AB8|nr:autotransporter serine protease [Lysobacter sp. S4-A87]UNK49512.1 S8 family serine peptidase [Lysobacter sp. S4-A87]